MGLINRIGGQGLFVILVPLQVCVCFYVMKKVTFQSQKT